MGIKIVKASRKGRVSRAVKDYGVPLEAILEAPPLQPLPQAAPEERRVVVIDLFGDDDVTT